MLAAILFTDVVNYAGRMSQDEEATLQLVQRDIAWITQQVDRHEGRVLKNTGDGLLICFTSVHECMNCALAIQDRLDDIVRHNPSHRALQHRMAVHVGDVFFMHNDIMGDGVNVAARLLQEGSPNSIILSQTVFELVKGALSVPLAYLGARQLKHIPLPMAVYQISPRSALKKSASQRIVPPGAGAGNPIAPPGSAAGIGVAGLGARRMAAAAREEDESAWTSQLPEIRPNPRDFGVRLADTQCDAAAAAAAHALDMESDAVHAGEGAGAGTSASASAYDAGAYEEGSTAPGDASAYGEQETHAGDDADAPAYDAAWHAQHAHIGIPNPHLANSGWHGAESAESEGAGDVGPGAAPQSRRPALVPVEKLVIRSPIPANAGVAPQLHAEIQQLHVGRVVSQAPYRFLFELACGLMSERGRFLEARMEEGWIRAMWPHAGSPAQPAANVRPPALPGSASAGPATAAASAPALPSRYAVHPQAGEPVAGPDAEAGAGAIAKGSAPARPPRRRMVEQRGGPMIPESEAIAAEAAREAAEEARRHPMSNFLKSLPRLVKDITDRVSAAAAAAGAGGKPDVRPVPASNETYVEIRFHSTSARSTLIDIEPDGKPMPATTQPPGTAIPAAQARDEARRLTTVSQITEALCATPHPVPPQYQLPDPHAPRAPTFAVRKGEGRAG
ncbi:hypothetical protein DB346_00460 [Verrucomicrobia bacterium LW23]|nr:hypothetical protein DB346_00460 [Verrucomicrobia bacterium LW23]